jgi:hypothetical protein
MNPEIEITGGAGDYEAAAIVGAIQAVLAEAEAKARRPATTSRWKQELEEFRPGRWGLAHRMADPSEAEG